METYRSTVDKDSWLVLSTEADLFRYLQSPNTVCEPGPIVEALIADWQRNRGGRGVPKADAPCEYDNRED